jgi:hypothetical protein
MEDFQLEINFNSNHALVQPTIHRSLLNVFGGTLVTLPRLEAALIAFHTELGVVPAVAPK